MNYYIIGTTAINRPMLHNDNIGEWMEWILGTQDQNTVLKWFINIDWVEKLGISYEETKVNFKKIINNKIDTVFLENPTEKGNFLEACKRISTNIEEYVCNLQLTENEKGQNIRIIWLEDDWKLNQQTKIPIREITTTYSTPNSHINLSFIRNNYIWALAPSIIGYTLWKKLHYTAWLNERNPVDPEHCVGLFYRNMIGHQDQLLNLTVINKPVKHNYLSQRHMTYTNSYYTYHDKKYKIDINDSKCLDTNHIKLTIGNDLVFIRITPSFCEQGCNYGRTFLEKYDIKKSHCQDINNFYK